MEQVRIVSLKCPQCGGALQVSPEMQHFACGYCGGSVVVSRSGGTISLGLEQVLANVQKGTDKTAAELAIPRLEREIREKEDEIQAETLNATKVKEDAGSTATVGCLALVILSVFGAMAFMMVTAEVSFGILSLIPVGVFLVASAILWVSWSGRHAKAQALAQREEEIKARLASHSTELEQLKTRLAEQRTRANS